MRAVLKYHAHLFTFILSGICLLDIIITLKVLGNYTITHETSPVAIQNCLKLRGSNGRWVQDWEYANRTAYRAYGGYSTWHIAQQNFTPTPEQPFRWATSWRWQDEHCPVNETSLEGFCKACHDLGVTRIFIVGDSLSMMFSQSLLSLLGFPPTGRRTTFNGRQKQFTLTCLHPSFGVTFWYYRRSPLSDLTSLVSDPQPTPQRDFIEKNPNRTAIIANVGTWLYSMEEYQQGFDSLIQWVDTFDPTKVLVFYRETIPGHPQCEPHGEKESLTEFNWITPVKVEPFVDYMDYADYRKNVTSLYQWNEFEQYNTYSKRKLANRTTDKVYIHWLNVFNSSVLRRDGHIGFGDCLHYYFPGPTDWWVHFWYSAMLDLSKQETEKRPSVEEIL